MTNQEQLRLWLTGKSVHNEETNECCPDFSCCIPSLEASQEDKLTFCNAWVNERYDITSGMMLIFLSSMVIARGMDQQGIYVGGFGSA